MDAAILFANFSLEVLKSITSHERMDIPELSKGELVNCLNTHCNRIGFVIIFTDSLTKDEMATACDQLNIDLQGEGNNPTKAVLKKRLIQKMGELGIQKFFDKCGDNSGLVATFAEASELDTKSTVKEVGKKISQLGVESLLNRLDIQFLKNMGDALDLGYN